MEAEALLTPAIVVDGSTVQRNLRRMADYVKATGLNLRPHTKTHKSIRLARMQMENGAVGLTVAKVGEAKVMIEAADEILMAYPAVDAARCNDLAHLARHRTIRVGIDSKTAADHLSQAASANDVTIGILVDLDVGMHRTGVQTPAEALELARHVSKRPGLRLDGVMFFPGQISQKPADQEAPLRAVDAFLSETLALWMRDGLEARIVSGGSTPTAAQSHLATKMTEIRPGTYIFNDMNGVYGGSSTLEDCAARIHVTIISTAVPGQIVIDAGTKTLTSDKCGPAPDSGHGRIVEFPDAVITKLSEEHGQVDVTKCSRAPKVGDRLTVIPNHICPCVNLQDRIYWLENGEVEPLVVDARGKVQ